MDGADEGAAAAADHAKAKRAGGSGIRGGVDHGGIPSVDAEHAPVGGLVGAGAGEIVERLLGDADDVVGDEPGALACAVLGMLETAFPLQHGPAREVVL